MSDVDVVILAGSKKNWSNGLNLNVIEHSASSQEEAWNNIVAINKVVKNLYALNSKITISAVQSNAGAGGVYLALATDYCFVKKGVVLNPHYKNMGLYGSELHTLTAHKFGISVLNYLKEEAIPITVNEALSLKLIDSLP
jgi:putative two-component system hydrogenase maturation factor HypX/HoxX